MSKVRRGKLFARWMTAAVGAVTVAASCVLGAASQVHAASASSCTTAPSGDAFYTPPNPLPSGAHGDIIWCRPTASGVSGVNAWQVLYLSTTTGGGATAVSGTVFVPQSSSAGIRPVAAYAAGTQGWGDQCAPSKEIASGTFDEQFAVNGMLTAGWAVAVTDYPGLGTPGDETYNVGIPEGYAILDSLIAAKQIPGSGLSASAPTAIEGYSQGGGGADWAAQLQPSYAPNLNLKGVAAGGTPANLQAVAANINGTTFFAFLAGTAIGFNAAYPSLNLLSDLTPAGQAAIAKLDTMCQTEALLTYAGQRIENYTVGGVNPINEPRWQTVLDANNLGSMKPGVPLLQYHGLSDEVIPYSIESALHDRYCAMGVRTSLTGFPGEHVSTQVLAQPTVISWIGARFLSLPPPSNC